MTKVSFCIPIKEQIFTSQGSDILSGKLLAFEALKTSLTGNYTYKNKALEKTTQYTTTKKILTGTTFSYLEIFTIGKNENVPPSKWQTDLYFPIQPKVVPQPYRKVLRDSTTTITRPPSVKAPVVKTPATKAPPVKEPATKKSQEEFEF